jgi:alkenylglycerophosphocholine/alkenylglycerophosphoethanolamine hydrolase
MITALAGMAAISALLAIACEWSGPRRRAFYVLKPLTTLLIIGVAAAAQPVSADYQHWVILALAFSLAGDVCLMFDGNGWFIGGLGSFLVAHGLFVVAFVTGLPIVLGVRVVNLELWCWLFPLYGSVFFGWLLPKTGKLMLPVIVYGAALMLMAMAASALWIASPHAGGALAFAGATLFVASDSALAVAKFKGPYPRAQPLILSTYWLAIGLIALSV